MQYYFDRTLPMFLTTEGSFDAVPVALDDDIAGFVVELTGVVARIEANMAEYGAPEDSAQQLADELALSVWDTDFVTGLVTRISALESALEEVEDEEQE